MRHSLPATSELIRAEMSRFAARNEELRVLHRLHAVLMASLGCSSSAVARWFGEHPRTVERWVRAFDESGVEGLRRHRPTGRPSRLDAAQRQRIGVALLRPPSFAGVAYPRWDGKLLARYVQAEFGIELGPRQCQRLLVDLQVSDRGARLEPEAADGKARAPDAAAGRHDRTAVLTER